MESRKKSNNVLKGDMKEKVFENIMADYFLQFNCGELHKMMKR